LTDHFRDGRDFESGDLNLRTSMQRQTDANDGGKSRAGVAVLDRDASADLSHAARSASLEARRLLFDRGSWTLVDQCVVSLGNFALNVQLARDLAAADYGKFVLFLGAIFALRCFDYSLISYPLSVRLHSAHRDEHAGLMANSALLASALGLVLLLLLVLGIQLLGGGDILMPAASCYLAWQAQETMRRCLLANFRYRAAVTGDAVTFIGQAVAIAVLAWLDRLTLATALYAISVTFVAGAFVHASKLHFARPNVAQAIRLARDYFALGKWSLLYYEMVLLRFQLFPWALAATAGTAATAAFQAAANIANVMNPIILGMGNAVPQAAAHAHVTDGVHGAWRTARGYILFGLPPIVAICVAGLVAPQLLLRLMYGASSPYLDAALAVQLLVVAMAAEYVGEMIGKTLLGVGAGRLASLVIGISFAAAVLTLPLIMMLGVVGAALALAITNLIRLVVAWLALRWLSAKEATTAELARTAEAA
jgi:O-antigen/teichoic acid export membrane protein